MIERHLTPTPGPAMHLAAQMSGHIPELETERLNLRAQRLDDYSGFAEIVCTERGIYVDGPMSQEDAWYDFCSMASCWMLHGHGGWSVESKSDGTLKGFVILGLEPGDHDVELGFLFLAHAEGKGFAYEAAKAVRAWAFETLKLPQLHSYIDERNVRSIALAKRLGAVDKTPLDWAGSGARLFLHTNTEANT